MIGSQPSDFPMEQHLHLQPKDGILLPNPTIYRRLVGRLLYLTVTRLDIQYVVNTLNQFMQSSYSSHLDAADRVLHYLKGSGGKGLFPFAFSSLTLIGCADFDWADCPTTRRSTTGYFTMLESSLISWKTKKQPTVSHSSAEAEYRSLAALTSELQQLKYILSDLGINHSKPISIHSDSQAAIHIVENLVFDERIKHIEIDYHFVREKIQASLLAPSYLLSSDQLVDLFTKPLGGDAYCRLLCKLGVDISIPTRT